jgi:hypothetical protein
MPPTKLEFNITKDRQRSMTYVKKDDIINQYKCQLNKLLLKGLKEILQFFFELLSY